MCCPGSQCCTDHKPSEQVWLKRLTNPEPGHKAIAGERASFLIFDPIAWDLVSPKRPCQHTSCGIFWYSPVYHSLHATCCALPIDHLLC